VLLFNIDAVITLALGKLDMAFSLFGLLKVASLRGPLLFMLSLTVLTVNKVIHTPVDAVQY
jgi:hypothetical protein